VLQLQRGHRFSSDDLLCAWAAAQARPAALRLLDLGAGVGSVGLMALWRLPPGARLVMVEAQQVSHDLARRSVALNGLEARVQARLGDLRDPQLVPQAAAYDLVTCSPPYIPPGRGVASPVPQRAAARLEQRGDIFDYLACAARALAPGGRVAIVFAADDPRPVQAMQASALALCTRRRVFFRLGRPASLALYTAGHAAGAPGSLEQLPDLALRDAQGAFTPHYLAIRRELDPDFGR